MADNFLGEIRILPFGFAPKGWATCNGQLLPISQNTALFSLLGTFYGGNGTSNFALPNLQGCVPVNMGQGAGLSPYSLGQTGGETAVTLTLSQIPLHTHALSANSGNGDVDTPQGNTWATSHLGKTPINIYNSSAGNGLNMNPVAFALAGGSLPHNNMSPYLVLNFCIALQGIFPPRS
jgi:microcystin-dependent protein